jgi:hypothetical protein
MRRSRFHPGEEQIGAYPQPMAVTGVVFAQPPGR